MLSSTTTFARDTIRRIFGRNPSFSDDEFIETFFDSTDEYQGYKEEFRHGRQSELREAATERYRELTGSDNVVGIDFEVGLKYYALVRKLKPTTIVETGVCNGVSTLCLLMALSENGTGTLHSVDYPYFADEPLSEFRAETFDEYGGAAIPADKEPGWIIPDDLTTDWELYTGKSQRVLPEILTKFDDIDVFIHDSEHSAPCMMFEYELAWEWLNDGGLLISDDISWNDAFDIFTTVRSPELHGRIAETVGYSYKSPPEAQTPR